MSFPGTLKRVVAGQLETAFVEAGPAAGFPVVLLHGFPYDIHAFEQVTLRLTARGNRVIVPYLRGFGATRFLSDAIPRSGEQAALGADLLALLDALSLPSPILAGFDWGGRAACVVAALHPSRCSGLVSANGYNIQNLAEASRPLPPAQEHRLWYQYYLHGSRGRSALAEDRRALCRLLWSLWSPSWAFTGLDFERTARAFDNDDFVDIVVHSYRHRFGLVAGDPVHAESEGRLARQPAIAVPTITLDGACDGVNPPVIDRDSTRFESRRAHHVLAGVGHNVPQEAPDVFASAITQLINLA